MVGLKNVPLAWDHPEFVSARHLLDLMKAGPCPTKKSLSSVDEQATNNQPTKKAGKVKDAQKEQLKSDDDGTIDEPTFPKFMDLPLEIRDQIYSLAIEIPKPSPGVMISFKEGQRAPILIPTDWQEVDFPRLHILQTSKQVYAEAFHRFYTDHTIAFRDIHCMYEFLCAIGSKRRRQLTSLFFDWQNNNNTNTNNNDSPNSNPKDCFRMLKTLPNLKSISLTFPCSTTHLKGLQALRKVRVLERATVLALQHTDATAVCNNDYWPVTADHTCYACHDSKDTNLHAAAELEQAMMRPRPKSYCRDDDGGGGGKSDVGKRARFGPGRSEVRGLGDDFVYVKRRKAKKKKKRAKKEPYTWVLPPGRDLIQFDTGYN